MGLEWVFTSNLPTPCGRGVRRRSVAQTGPWQLFACKVRDAGLCLSTGKYFILNPRTADESPMAVLAFP